MQKVHFSITPFSRTVTSGFSCCSSGAIPMMIVVIEVADLVGAVHRARARADAAVVDLHVEAVLVVIRGSDRAHRLARRRLAVLAQHRDEAQLHVGILAFPVALDADPLHLAALRESLLADDGQIVLGLARDHARLAAGAAIEIDRHGPGVVELLVVAGPAVFAATSRAGCVRVRLVCPARWAVMRTPP